METSEPFLSKEAVGETKTVHPSHHQTDLKPMVSRLTMHGISELVESTSKTEKIVWSVVIGGAIIMAILQIYLTVNTYIESPIMTTYSVVRTSGIDMPDVLICPANFVDKTKLNSIDRSENNSELIELMEKFFSYQKKNVKLNMINGNLYASPLIARASESDILQYFLSNVSISQSDFVRECNFKSIPVKCDDYVTPQFHGNLGWCFVIKSNFTQTMAGYGLSLALDIHRDLYPDDLLPPFDGIYVQIRKNHDAGETRERVLVQPGGWTKIDLEAKNYKLINGESGKVVQKCISSLSEKACNIINCSHYTSDQCYRDCGQMFSIDRCNCTLPIHEKFLKREYQNMTCQLKDVYRCFLPNLIKNMQVLSICISSCLSPCDFWEFEKSVTSLKFSASDLQDNSKMAKCFPFSQNGDDNGAGNTNDNRWCKDTILLDISFQDLKYTQIVQSQSMTFDTFIGNIGGQVGLWMGISVISIAQIISLAINCCVQKCCQNDKEI